MSLEKAMKRVCESTKDDKSKGLTLVREAFVKGDFKVSDFSIKRLALETMGADWVERLSPKAGIQTAPRPQDQGSEYQWQLQRVEP